MRKEFKDVNPGDKIYKVCVYDYKTRIITKKVKDVKHKGECRISILCECKDSEYYSNFFVCLPIDKSISKDKYSLNSYICTSLEDAKIACHKLANEIVEKTEKEIAKLYNRLNKWTSHKFELHENNYIIK